MKSLNLSLIVALLAYSSFAKTSQVKSIGGNDMPQAVIEIIEKAKKDGALFYDVNDTNKEGELKYSPHVMTSQAEGPMSFDYTEITPEILEKDIKSTELTTIISGYKSFEFEEQDEQGKIVKKTGEEAIYKEFFGGTGNVQGFYDEAYHSDYYARGSSGQKWANNCGLLEDGSLHCLPAMRRSDSSGGYVLVNPDLSRGKLMIYNGHIEIDGGVVVSVELSGRLAKLIAKGKIKLIDPLDLLKAWGFKLSSGLSIVYGNTESGVPVKDPITGLLVAAEKK